jgi:glycine/serine hydroxymethyltransferase
VDLHISSLTKAALKSAKARGVRLGAPDMAKLGVDVQAVADVYSRFRTLGATSAELNRLGVPTAKGARWHPRTVSIALKSQKAVDIPLPSE